MSEQEQAYSVGNWIVHITYGVGQIKKLEIKPISGTERLCYRVRTDNGVFWLPADRAADNERVRPIAGPRRIQRALDALRKVPEAMAKKYQARHKRIRNVALDGDLTSDLKLLRDLNARQFKKGLNSTEQVAFNTIIKHFVREWSLSRGIEISEARQKLERFLQESRKKGESKQQENVAA